MRLLREKDRNWNWKNENVYCLKTIIQKSRNRRRKLFFFFLFFLLFPFFSSFFSFFSFFLFFERETRPRVETEGMTLPKPPEGTGQKCRFSRKKLEKWMDKKVPALLMQRSRIINPKWILKSKRSLKNGMFGTIRNQIWVFFSSKKGGRMFVEILRSERCFVRRTLARSAFHGFSIGFQRF